MIRVWKFRDAPEQLQALSQHGGDEDWLAVLPADYPGYVGWAEYGTPFGVFSVSQHELADGSTVLIGAHA